MNNEGISKAGGLLDVGVELGVIEKSGSFFSYKGKSFAQGREAAKVFISENKKFLEELEKKIRESLVTGKELPKELGEEKEEE